MSKTEHKLVIKKTTWAKVFALLFLLPGILTLYIGSRYCFFEGQTLDGSLMMTWGALFAGVGLFLLTRGHKLSINKRKGLYRQSREFNLFSFVKPKQSGKITDIYALQLISEQINSRSNNGGAQSFTSFELNLVLKDGTRIHIMDHGNGKDVENSAKILSEFLNVPILKAHY